MIHSTVEEVYDKIANEFSTTRANKWPFIDQFMVTVPKGSKILDIGCGNGRNMCYPDYDFRGVDISNEFVKICCDKGLNVKKGTMTELPYKNNSFDAILSIASFHHLNNETDRNKALQEMKRVLQPGGMVLLYVWSKNQPKRTKRIFENYGDVLVPWKSKNGKIYNRYYYIFQMEEIEELIKKNGFTIKKHIWDYGNEIFILTL